MDQIALREMKTLLILKTLGLRTEPALESFVL